MDGSLRLEPRQVRGVVGEELVGRDDERRVVASFLAALPAGSAALVLTGEAGIGKTALWNEALESATGQSYRVLSAQPAQSEAKLAYSVLGDLLEPELDDVIGSLPAPRRRALEIALLREETGDTRVDQRAISVAVVEALRTLASSGPVLVAVDDLQWADRPSLRVVEYSLRRLGNEPVGFLATLRAGHRLPSLLERALTERNAALVEIEPLSLGAVRQLVRTRTQLALTRPALVRVHRMSRGNPFHVLEIARALEGRKGDLRAGDLVVPDALSTLLHARLSRVPIRTRRTLLAVAALGRPTEELVVAALGDPQAVARDLERARSAGILMPGTELRFTHPLLGSVCYRELPQSLRSEIHRRLAAALTDPEERARHLALAVEEPDEEVAAALTDAARRAVLRGAPDAAAELAELACTRTPPQNVEQLQERRLELGEFLLATGDSDRARAVLEQSVRELVGKPSRARAVQALSRLLYQTEGPRSAAAFCERVVADAHDDVALQVVALTANDYDFDLPRAEVSLERALELVSRLDPPRPRLHAWTLKALVEARFNRGQGVDLELVAEAFALEGEVLERAHLADRWWACVLKYCDDFERSRAGLESAYREAHETGDEGRMPHLLGHISELERWAGNWDLQERYVAEHLELSEDTGQPYQLCWALPSAAFAAALRGRIDDAETAAREGIAISKEIDSPHTEGYAEWAFGFAELSRDRLDDAVTHLRRAERLRREVGLEDPGRWRFQGDYVEALVGVGELEEAAAVADSLAFAGRRLDRPWALAVGARSRALCHAAGGELEDALELFDEALVEHARLPMPFELARTLLAMGRAERRAKRKRRADASLQRALAMFEGLGAPLWAEKARLEQGRVGLRPRAPRTLTATETRVAELAAGGLTNKEVAAAAFMSEKTVEANLTRAYRKLGIHSRAELGAWLAARDRASSP
jgi:DNA-binding CsgD family transcriptional regulator